MRRRSTDPVDIEITSQMKVMFFDYDLKPRNFYWNIYGKVVLTCWGHGRAVIADTPGLAIEKFGKGASL